MDSLPNPAPGSREAVSRENVVRVVGLTKVFKDFWGRPKARAVNDVSFDIRRGEIFGLLGPNGSGKSTTIKMLLGLLYPTHGHIEVFGQSPRDVRTKERIGYLPEESYLYKYLNPGETLDFFGNLFQLDSADRRQRAEQLIEMVGLNQARTRTVGEFSKGMQRRIGLAQALINDPDLVILDEPTAGLDPLGCREVKDLILALARRGKTVILSSHLLADVEDVCDRVVIYYGGRIQAMGTLQDLLAAPDSVQISSPVLSREVTERVLGILRAEVGDRVRLGTPTQNLETYFLGVVERARAGGQTSGATSGNRVAQFIRGKDAGRQTQSDKVLDRLTRQNSLAEVQVVPAPSTEPQIDLARLSSLARSEPAAEIPPATTPSVEVARAVAPPPTAIDVKQANEKLSGLLGGKK
ncbi:MAG: ABC transporter ATP-binding protein [Pedosphaera sp.]|nr:ABC transporter ATP-binding protein [Pedosphaera sp.]